MANYQPVAIGTIKSLNDAKLRNAPIVFHAVNKSGSLVASRVLKESYEREGRTQRFMSTYFKTPPTRDETLDRIKNDNGQNQFLIDHGLIGLEKIAANVQMITFLRHPIRRIISVYYWLQSHHPEVVMGRDLINWARMEGIHHSQIRQFSFDHFSSAERGAVVNWSISEITNRALEYFEKNIAWFGIAEMFDESIMALHWELGLEAVGQSEPDQRNKSRPSYQRTEIQNGQFKQQQTTLSKKYFETLEEILAYDIVFYEVMRRKFCDYLSALDMSIALEKYREGIK